MAIHNPRTKEQRTFLADVETARAAGVDVGSTCSTVYQSILGGLSSIQFPGTNWGAVALTDEYLSYLSDSLHDRAIEQGKG